MVFCYFELFFACFAVVINLTHLTEAAEEPLFRISFRPIAGMTMSCAFLRLLMLLSFRRQYLHGSSGQCVLHSLRRTFIHRDGFQ